MAFIKVIPTPTAALDLQPARGVGLTEVLAGAREASGCCGTCKMRPLRQGLRYNRLREDYAASKQAEAAD